MKRRVGIILLLLLWLCGCSQQGRNTGLSSENYFTGTPTAAKTEIDELLDGAKFMFETEILEDYDTIDVLYALFCNPETLGSILLTSQASSRIAFGFFLALPQTQEIFRLLSEREDTGEAFLKLYSDFPIAVLTQAGQAEIPFHCCVAPGRIRYLMELFMAQPEFRFFFTAEQILSFEAMMEEKARELYELVGHFSLHYYDDRYFAAEYPTASSLFPDAPPLDLPYLQDTSEQNE